MPIVSFAGSSFTVSVESGDVTAQITRGGITSTPNIVTTKTLGPNKATTQTDVEDAASFDFLYDGDDGDFYSVLWTASRTGASLTVSIEGGGGEWSGEMTVTDLGVEFAAEDASTCTATFTATGDPLDFAAVTP